MKLWYSNKLDRLVDRFIANTRAERKGFPQRIFHTTKVVVPNRNIESYLKFEIARRTGISANIEFFFLEDYLNRVLAEGRPNARLLRRDDLVALILGILETGPLPVAVSRYIQSGPDSEAQEVRRFQLAQELAKIFESYSLSRLPMLDAWSQERQVFSDDDTFRETEDWQAEIWRAIFGKNGRIEQLNEDADTSLVALHDLLNNCNKIEFKPARIHLFGFSYIAQTYQQILSGLSERLQIDLYTFVPMMEFAEDYHSAGIQPPEHAKSLDDNTVESIASVLSSGTTLSRIWALPGRENLHLFHQLNHCQLQPQFPSPVGAEEATLLQRLQTMVATQQPSPSPIDADDSLAVLACPSLEREVEIVGHQIWSLIKQSEEKGQRTLRFHDIGIIIADRKRLQTYQNLIRTRFAQLHDIPCSFTDVSLVNESALLQAAMLLLDLPFSNWCRADVMQVLLHPALQAAFPDVDTQMWAKWAQQLGIYIGQDAQALQNTYISNDIFNWDQGLRRLALGAFLNVDDDAQRFEVGDKSHIPHDLPQGQSSNAALLIALVRSLVEDTRFVRKAKLTYTQWSTFFQHYFSSYLAADSEQAQNDLGLCLRQAFKLRDYDLDQQPVSYTLAAEIVKQGLESLSGSQGNFLADGVVVSSFLPMRPIPFRVAFVLGLGEGCFPAQHQDNALDLRLARLQPGDVNARQRDEYLFLETIMSTAEKLILTYVARDAHSGDELNPSSVLDGLFYALSNELGVSEPEKRLVKVFPLHRFEEPIGDDWCVSPELQDEVQARRLRDELLKTGFTPTQAIARVAAVLPQPVRSFLRCPTGPEATTSSQRVDGSKPIVLSLATIRRFLECPLQGWGSRLLGREEDWEDGLDVEEEPWLIGRLQRATLLRNIFWDAVANGEPDFEAVYQFKTTQLEEQSVFPTGPFFHTQRHHLLEILKNWYAHTQQAGAPPLSEYHVARFGRAEQLAQVDHVYPPIELTVTHPASGDSLAVELVGMTEAIHQNWDCSLVLVARKLKDLDFIRGFIDYVALSAAGLCNDRFRALTIPAEMPRIKGKDAPEKMRRIWPSLTSDSAREFLRCLISELLFEPHEYILPADVVLEIQQSNHQKSARDIVAPFKVGKKDLRTEYGPVPKPKQYDAPDDSLTRQIIDRRWNLFFQDNAAP